MSDEKDSHPEERMEQGAADAQRISESPAAPSLPEPPTQPVPAPSPEPATEGLVGPSSLGQEPVTEPVRGPAAPEGPGHPGNAEPPPPPAPEDTPPAASAGSTAPSDGGPAAEDEPVAPDRVFLFEEQQFDIKDIPENAEESEDGFALVPPGPTEEVDFGEDRSWRSRRMRRGRGRGRGAMREAQPVSPQEPLPQPAPARGGKYRAAIVAAIVVLAILLFLGLLTIAIVIWYNQTQGPRAIAPDAVKGSMSFAKEGCHVCASLERFHAH